jgi:hypothetical protein
MGTREIERKRKEREKEKDWKRERERERDRERDREMKRKRATHGEKERELRRERDWHTEIERESERERERELRRERERYDTASQGCNYLLMSNKKKGEWNENKEILFLHGDWSQMKAESLPPLGDISKRLYHVGKTRPITSGASWQRRKSGLSVITEAVAITKVQNSKIGKPSSLL